QAALTQPPSVSANPGETVRITCSGSNDWFGWFQQKVPGSASVTVIYVNTNRPSNIPSQFSRSTSGTMGTLTVTGVQAEDEAVYYCGGWDSSAGQCPCALQSAHGWALWVHCYHLLCVDGSDPDGGAGGCRSDTAPVLTQPRSVSANPGETVRTTCSRSSNNYGWHQQKVPGSAPLTVIYSSNQRPSDIPSRFSGTKSGSTGTLTITGVQAEDEAVYYCGGWDSS
ncbi:LV1 protein, partial [Nyctibius bracteatus]|nr:LV1 protein [Nyctibius bracteatus]